MAKPSYRRTIKALLKKNPDVIQVGPLRNRSLAAKVVAQCKDGTIPAPVLRTVVLLPAKG
jgi:type II secretory ATPase GspE/PulE/Tfp pilus assembly ATPase PilB-like protein